MQVFAFLFVFSWIIRSLYDICMYERDCDPVISGHGHGHFHFSIIFDFGRL